ncbi:uncharacterized protein LOC128982489 [Macrosteles quadrilineatus]|uniref:uncharacterized protein LOC128982489 n=1 Tax=Macrosteles quadrilineatus TaxID=74068 RepID=UPI0023E15E92|nr:uncharacterized protein LOC128982489 [Macrosteles quadrilineatus]
MYGLPKIHKPNVPLRPIVSSRDSACRELSKVLLDILKPLVGNTDSFIKNSKDFVEKSKSIVLADTDKLVSFDVESLFTNVPVSETLKIIETRLTNDDTLANRTKLPVNVIMELLDLCTQCNYFQLEGKLYRQDEGMAMGSPLSPIFANIFMEEFEQKALASARLKPKIWWRYVDDTFVVFPHGDDKLNEFLEHLNSVSSSIKLTMEVESQNKLPFLDVCVEKHLNSLRTSVYRKKTHTGQYLNFQSNQQISVKEGVAYSLFDRAKSICSNQDELKDEIKKVEQDLASNGYPRSIISKCRKDRATREPLQNRKEKLVHMSIPYVSGLSEKIRRAIVDIGRVEVLTFFMSASRLSPGHPNTSIGETKVERHHDRRANPGRLELSERTELKSLKTERTQLRRTFTKCRNEMDKLLNEDSKDEVIIKSNLNKLQDKADRLFNEDIKEALFEDPATKEEDLEDEFDTAES